MSWQSLCGVLSEALSPLVDKVKDLYLKKEIEKTFQKTGLTRKKRTKLMGQIKL